MFLSVEDTVFFKKKNIVIRGTGHETTAKAILLFSSRHRTVAFCDLAQNVQSHRRAYRNSGSV
jgi:hypothetical protein